MPEPGAQAGPADPKVVEFQGHDVRFEIRKLLPMPAKQVFTAHVRPLLAEALQEAIKMGVKLSEGMEPEDLKREGMKLMAGAFAGAPQVHYEAIVHAMYDQIWYTKNGEGPIRLTTDVENGLRRAGPGAHSAARGEGLCGKFSRVLGRARVGVTPPRPRFSVASTVNIEPFFGHPVAAKLCTLKDLKSRRPDGDPVLDLADVCDLNEILIIESHNEAAASKAANKKSHG